MLNLLAKRIVVLLVAAAVAVVVEVVSIVAGIVVAETKKNLSYDKSSDKNLQYNNRVTTEGSTAFRFRVPE